MKNFIGNAKRLLAHIKQERQERLRNAKPVSMKNHIIGGVTKFIIRCLIIT